MSKPCPLTCFIALAIVVAMVIMSLMVSRDPVVKSYRDHLPDDIKPAYDEIVAERLRIYLTGYLIGFIVSICLILFNVLILKKKIPISLMVCITVVVSTFVNYFYYILSPKSNYVISLLKSEEQKAEWLKVYKSMQYYYHFSFVLGVMAVGAFTYMFR